MLTVIVDARVKAERLPVILSQLTAGAVDGLVRQVLLIAEAGEPGIAQLCDESGAEAHPTFAAAGRAARYGLVLVLPADFRFRDGWIRALDGQDAPALVVGRGSGGLFSRPPTGVLLERALLEQGVDDVAALRRRLGLRVRRIG